MAKRIEDFVKRRGPLSERQVDLVREWLAAHPWLETIEFPVASPDLNPQEHVWKATRRAISHNHARRRLPELADKFAMHLRTQTFSSSFLDRYGFNALRPRFT